MNMSEAIKSVFSKYATFSGRARRSEYWYFQLFVWLVNMVFAVLLRNLHPGSSLYRLISGLDGLFSLVIFVPSLAVTCSMILASPGPFACWATVWASDLSCLWPSWR